MNQTRERGDLSTAGHQHRADFDDLVLGRTGLIGVGFQVEHHELKVGPAHIPVSAPSYGVKDARRGPTDAYCRRAVHRIQRVRPH